MEDQTDAARLNRMSSDVSEIQSRVEDLLLRSGFHKSESFNWHLKNPHDDILGFIATYQSGPLAL